MADFKDQIQSDDDVEEILRLAVRSQGIEGSTLRERLNASASELGISKEALQEAERQWSERKQSAESIELEEKDRTLYRKLRRGDFITSLGTYVAVNAFLLWIDGGGDNKFSWSLWVLAAWGIAVVSHIFSLFGHSAETEAKFQKWRRKRYKNEKRVSQETKIEIEL